MNHRSAIIGDAKSTRSKFLHTYLRGLNRIVTEMLSPDLEVSSITSSSAEGNGTGMGGGGGVRVDRDLLGVTDRDPYPLLDP